MRRMFILLTLMLIIFPVVASEISSEHFPMIKERMLFYDDRTVEQVVGIGKVEVPTDINSGSQNIPIYIFKFDNYFYQERIFFRHRLKIFEWVENHRRLRYDFGARVGDSWEMRWMPINEGVEVPLELKPRLNDTNNGAMVKLVAKGLKIVTPMGEFANVFHFRIERPITEVKSSYLEEWFAPGVGCIQRQWNTMTGIRMHKLVKIQEKIGPRPDLALNIDMLKHTYILGDSIVFDVRAFNLTNEEVVLNFPSSLQVDFKIDDVYTFSENHAFTQEETSITIEPDSSYIWHFALYPDDPGYNDIPLGKHEITAKIENTKFTARTTFSLIPPTSLLPEGIALTAATGKKIYNLGEPVDVSLTVSNTTDSDITLNIVEKFPLKFGIDPLFMFPPPLKELPPTIPVVIPAQNSVTFTEILDAAKFLLRPGDYTLFAGLTGYVGGSLTEFSVLVNPTLGTISGLVFTMEEDGETQSPVANAQIYLKPAVPVNLERDLSDVSFGDMPPLWATITDADGEFTLTNVPVGMFFNLNVAAKDFFPFHETFRMLDTSMNITVELKPKVPVSDVPLNFRYREMKGLEITFGTGKTVYQPDSPFRAFLRIANHGLETVQFTFDSEQYVEWSIRNMEGGTVWSSSNNGKKRAATAEFLIEIAPGEARVFKLDSTFAGKVPEEGGKFTVHGALKYTSASIEDLLEEDTGGFAKVLIVPSKTQQLMVKAHLGQMMVDLKDSLKTYIDMAMKDEDTSGEMSISEVLENFHDERPNHQFLKMIEVDADSTIRGSLTGATIRIYFDPEEFGENFDPLKLSIAHWTENVSWDPGEKPVWEALECRIDTQNKFVEAYTESFSSFGLFIDDESTDIGKTDEAPISFMLEQNYPNPFNPSTVIQFSIPETEFVKLSVYNILGQEVARLIDATLSAGTHSVVFDGSSMANGIYIYRIEAPGFVSTRSMLLVK